MRNSSSSDLSFVARGCLTYTSSCALLSPRWDALGRIGFMRLSYAVHGAIWIAVYLLFILAPLFALLAGTWPFARDFWTEFAVALGYSGLAMMGLQIGLTARFR